MVLFVSATYEPEQWMGQIRFKDSFSMYKWYLDWHRVQYRSAADGSSSIMNLWQYNTLNAMSSSDAMPGPHVMSVSCHAMCPFQIMLVLESILTFGTYGEYHINILEGQHHVLIVGLGNHYDKCVNCLKIQWIYLLYWVWESRMTNWVNWPVM